MLEDLKEEEIVNKVGGRFKLSTLIQKRMVALNTGAKPLVESRNPDRMHIVLQEILEDKIYLDISGELRSASSSFRFRKRPPTNRARIGQLPKRPEWPRTIQWECRSPRSPNNAKSRTARSGRRCRAASSADYQIRLTNPFGGVSRGRTDSSFLRPTSFGCRVSAGVRVRRRSRGDHRYLRVIARRRAVRSNALAPLCLVVGVARPPHCRHDTRGDRPVEGAKFRRNSNRHAPGLDLVVGLCPRRGGIRGLRLCEFDGSGNRVR